MQIRLLKSQIGLKSLVKCYVLNQKLVNKKKKKCIKNNCG